MYPIKGNTAEKWHNGHCQVFISHRGTGIANQFWANDSLAIKFVDKYTSLNERENAAKIITKFPRYSIYL